MKVAFLISILFFATISNAASDPNEISYDWLKNLIITKKLTTIDSVIPLLPKTYRESFLLMRESHSMQEASLENPRAIVFGQNAKLIMAFNGDSSQKNYNQLELIEFNDQAKAFEFRTILFGEGEPKFSNVNPSKCLSCHGAVPQPLWDDYKKWPGMIAANDELDNDDEIELLKSKRLRSNLRYQSLFGNNSELFPYAIFTSDHKFRPGNRLLKNIIRKQSVANAARIAKSEAFKRYEPLVLYSLMRCNVTPSATPAYVNAVKDLYGADAPALINEIDADPGNHSLRTRILLLGKDYDSQLFDLSVRNDHDSSRYLYQDGSSNLYQLTVVNLIEAASPPYSKLISRYKTKFCDQYNKVEGPGQCSGSVGSEISAAYDSSGPSFYGDELATCETLRKAAGITAPSDQYIGYDLVSQQVFKPKCLSCHSFMSSSNETHYKMPKIIDRIYKNNMPPAGAPLLTDCEQAIVKSWISIGSPKESRMRLSNLEECDAIH